MEDAERTRTGIGEYAVSKLCNVLFASELKCLLASGLDLVQTHAEALERAVEAGQDSVKRSPELLAALDALTPLRAR